MNDDFGDRMKLYEELEAGRRLMPMLPTLARIDGKCFHRFTRGMDRPFDARFAAAMVATTLYLTRETNACMGYTQSDEITLLWQSARAKSQIYFDGRIAKMISGLAALATLYFYQRVLESMPEFASRMPTFDARVWQVPNRAEAANVFLWREQDATRNSINMAAQSVYSHKALMGKTSSQKQEMLFAKGINWNDYPAGWRRGTYVQRRVSVKPFSVEEIEKLPPKHAARSNPNLLVERTEWAVLNLPPLRKVSNREEVIFDGAAAPI